MNKIDVPKVAYFDIADPRLGHELHKKIIQKGQIFIDALKKQSIELLNVGKVIDTEICIPSIIDKIKADGACGIIIRTAWFHRSNVPVAIAQYSGLPCMLCAFPNPDDTGFEGLALAHGALDEIGLRHSLNYGFTEPESMDKIISWIKACYAKKRFYGSVYGEIGGRCLEMIPASSDYNQLRRIFGIHVDNIEQWTLIRRAENIEKEEWLPVVKNWRKIFKNIECKNETLEKSAKLYLAGKKIFVEKNWDFAGIQCQLEMIDNYLAPCLPVAMWNEEGFTVSCETDINNALGMYLVQSITGKPGMFCDIYHFDEMNCRIHALNCGTAAPYIAGGHSNIKIVEQTPMQGTWDEKNKCSFGKGGACTKFVMPDGPVTILRFGRIAGEYVMHIAKGDAVKRIPDKFKLEGLGEIWPFAYIGLKEEKTAMVFLEKMRSHHAVIARGDCFDAIKDFAEILNIKIL